MSSTQLKNFRRISGMTQRELSSKIGITIQQISNYENGRSKVPKVVELALHYLASQENFDDSSFEKDWNRKDMEAYDAL